MNPKEERQRLFKHASTILVGQLAVMAFSITDTLVAGRYDQHALAALSVGSAVFISVFIALMGILQSLLPTLAEMHGAHQPLEVGRQFRQGLYLLMGTTLLGMGVLLSPGLILSWTHVPDALRQDVSQYLSVLAMGLPLALFFRMFSTLNQSLGRPKLVTWVQLAGLMAKIPLSIAFTFGVWGLPAMGVVGCAWATFVVNAWMVLLSLYLLRSQPLYRPYQIWQGLERPDPKRLWNLLSIGLPNALSVTVEVTSFTLMALFIARQGSVNAAAHQITSSTAALLWMTPMSFSIATSARVSFWLGAKDPVKARMVMKQGFLCIWLSAAVLSLLVLTLRPQIAQLFSTHAEVTTTAAGVLIWLSLYHWGDATQVMCFFNLRSYKITVLPVLIYGVLLWGVGLMGGYQLAYEGLPFWGLAAMPTPKTFWLTSSVAVLASSATMYAVLQWVSRREIKKCQTLKTEPAPG
jgi:multidrug resistance protein, MATE family